MLFGAQAPGLADTAVGQGDRGAARRLGGAAAEGARRALGRAVRPRQRQPPGAVRALRRRSPSTPCTSPTTAGRRPSPMPTAWPRPSVSTWRRPAGARRSSRLSRPRHQGPHPRRRARGEGRGRRAAASTISRRPRWPRRPRRCSPAPAGCPSRCARRGRASRPAPTRRGRRAKRQGCRAPATGRRSRVADPHQPWARSTGGPIFIGGHHEGDRRRSRAPPGTERGSRVPRVSLQRPPRRAHLARGRRREHAGPQPRGAARGRRERCGRQVDRFRERRAWRSPRPDRPRPPARQFPRRRRGGAPLPEPA